MRMSQQMKLAPRMIQSMEILQLPTMELQERIDQELAENFLLEQLNPEPGGPTPHELVRLLRPLVRHPRALGLSLTVYDPALDPDRSCARLLVNMLEALLGPPITH